MLNCDIVNRDIAVTPEILSDLEEFSKKALKHFDEYDIPKLRAELLGHHINNLQLFICCCLTVDPKTNPKSFFPISIDPRCPGRGIPSKELGWVKIITKIKREIDNFPRLVSLNDILWDFFRQMKETLCLTGVTSFDGVTVGC